MSASEMPTGASAMGDVVIPEKWIELYAQAKLGDIGVFRTDAPDVVTLIEENAALRREVAALRAPVTVEWVKSQRPGWGIEGVDAAARMLTDLLAARASAQGEKGNGNG